MSVRIQYAYLKQQTWLYRRNYPVEMQGVLGAALKQSLKTGDAKVAKVRAAEVNAKYEEIVAKAREGVVLGRPEPIRVSPKVFAPVVVIGRLPVARLAKDYLAKRAKDCKPTVSAVLSGFLLVGYRVSVWTHTKTPPAFRFCRFPIRVAVVGGRMMRRSGSSRKAIAMA